MTGRSQSQESAQSALAVLIDALEEDRKATHPLRAVTALFDSADRDARMQDAQSSGPLHGWISVLKACIPAGPQLFADCGSAVLNGVRHPTQAPIVARLQSLGVVVAGHAAMSEWSGMRSTIAPSGWSAMGGQVGNPRVGGGSPWGSSSGSASAVAAGWVRASIGTDTSGSVTLPAAATGVVGFRPTHLDGGLAGAIGISPNQDRPGLLTRNVDDLVQLWSALNGREVGQWVRHQKITVIDVGAGPLERATFDQWIETLSRYSWETTEYSPDSIMEICSAPDELELLVDDFALRLIALIESIGPQIECDSLLSLLRMTQAHAEEKWSTFGGDLFEAACRGPHHTFTENQRKRSVLERRATKCLMELVGDGRPVGLLVPLSSWPLAGETPDAADPPCVYPTVAPCVAGWPQICIPIATNGPPVGVVLTMTPGCDAELIALARVLMR